MIDSTSSPDPAGRSPAYSGELQQNWVRRSPVPGDSISTGQADELQAALERDPEIRPAVVAHGQELAADPGYPPASVIARVAAQILNTPDPSDDES